jgi:hypothetical protein
MGTRLVLVGLLRRGLTECWTVVDSKLPSDSCGTGGYDIGGAVTECIGRGFRSEGETRASSCSTATVTTGIAVGSLDVGHRRLLLVLV